MPVHWSGRICDMKSLIKISNKYKIPIVEDACHAIVKKKMFMQVNLEILGVLVCTRLKILVWGDGGYIVVKKKKITNTFNY